MAEPSHKITLRQDGEAVHIVGAWPAELHLDDAMDERIFHGKASGAAYDEDDHRILYFRLANGAADYWFVRDEPTLSVWKLVRSGPAI